MQSCYSLRRVNQILNFAERTMGVTHLRSMPTNVDVVLTKACNLACRFCRDYETKGSQKTTLEQFSCVAGQLLPYASCLSICSGGEPYLYTGLEEVLRIAARYGVFRFLLSNGMVMTRERIATIVEEELVSEHAFSVDGLSAATVEQIRTRAKLSTILHNIHTLMDLRNKRANRLPAVSIRYALMRMNIEELPRAVEYWGTLGIERIVCSYVVLANGIPKEESLYFHQELTARVFARARECAARYPGLKLELPQPTGSTDSSGLKPRKCFQPWNFVMIDTNGQILPCYNAFEGITMGSVHLQDGQPFRNIWNNPSYRQLRSTVNTDSTGRHYRHCARCVSRIGYGSMEAHLGDEVWIQDINEGRAQSVTIDHRRWKPKQREAR